mmetsp:Transcript_8882/g.19174  ORF Transcript_8882/g.19174 Transcript_8882/m.19174 type:complete len:250 (+) Transcript_8882:2-751(+)
MDVFRTKKEKHDGKVPLTMNTTNKMFLTHPLPTPTQKDPRIPSTTSTTSTVSTSAGRSPPTAMAISAGSVRSASIPVPDSHHGERTQSQVQLCIDEEAAEQREQMMFYRLINGMRDRHQKLVQEQSFPPQQQHQYGKPPPPMLSGNASRHDRSDVHHPAHHAAAKAPQHLEFPAVVAPQYATSAEQASPMLSSAASHSDEWSITGFNSPRESPAHNPSLGGIAPPEIQLAAAAGDRDRGEEEGIFDLEL